jgi:hypothetical protein
VKAALLLGVLAAAACGGRPNSEEVGVIAAGDRRILAEVLNASGRRGLARQGTAVLRERGVDVVYFGTADTAQDSTLVLARRGDLETAERVQRALGGGIVQVERDTLRRVDVTVLLGRDWTPPPGIRP